MATSRTTKTENKEDRVICLSRPKGNNGGIRKEIINKKGHNGSTVSWSNFQDLHEMVSHKEFYERSYVWRIWYKLFNN